jgi:hypothetical protein
MTMKTITMTTNIEDLDDLAVGTYISITAPVAGSEHYDAGDELGFPSYQVHTFPAQIVSIDEGGDEG